MLASLFYLACAFPLLATCSSSSSSTTDKGNFVALKRQAGEPKNKNVVLLRFLAATLPLLTGSHKNRHSTDYIYEIIKAIQRSDSATANHHLENIGSPKILSAGFGLCSLSQQLSDFLPKDCLEKYSESERDALKTIDEAWIPISFKTNGAIIVNPGTSRSLVKVIFVDGKFYQLAYAVAEGTADKWFFCKFHLDAGVVSIQSTDKEDVEFMEAEPNLLPESLRPILLAYVPEI